MLQCNINKGRTVQGGQKCKHLAASHRWPLTKECVNYLLQKMRVQARKWARQSLRYAAKPAMARVPGLLPSMDAQALNPARWLVPEETAPLQAPPPDKAQAPAGDEQWLEGSFTHRGRTLDYRLYLPPEIRQTEPLPMVVMLHGCTQDAQDFAAGTQMNVLARAQRVVVLYPQQSARDNPKKCWNWFTPQNQQRERGEPAVLAALTLSIAASQPVDRSRIYVAGLSAGGAMADILGTTYPEIFAAIGVHSGLPKGCATDVVSALTVMRIGCPLHADAPASDPVPPTIVFHGDADSTVHVSNGIAIVDAALKARGVQDAQAQPTEGQSAQGQNYSQTVYRDSAGRAIVEYWQLHGAGHAWSGGNQDGSYTDPAGVDASAQMLRFFLENPKTH